MPGYLIRLLLLVGFAFVSPVLAQPPTDQNMVANPGFEQLTADGRAVGWACDRSIYRVSDESPHSGKSCLRFENHDTGRYVLCSRAIKLRPGDMYELEAWVRTEGIEGEDSGAAICIEWQSDKGKWMGGSYVQGVKGTHRQWKRIHGRTPEIPEGAAGFTISCYVRKGMTGVAWWDDVAVRRYYPPLVDTIVTDAYRNLVDAGSIAVDVGLGLKAYRVPITKWTATLTVLDAHNRTVATQPAGHLALDHANFQLDTTSWEPGTYTLRCTVRTEDGRLHASCDGRLRRVAKLPDRKAWIDRHRRLILDGKPFFPLGTYWGNVTEHELDVYAESPFNCLMPYRAIDRKTLDRVDKAGLKVIYSVKDIYYGMKWTPKSIKNRDDERRVIEARVAQLRDHPAIMAWYINDELPLSMLDQLTQHRDWLEQLDPGRPTWVVLYQVDHVRSYLPTFDVIGTDPYPIPERSIGMPLQWTRKTVDAVFGKRAVWMVPQIFDWAAYRRVPEQKRKSRPPTLREMRCMAWQCIAGGANGLVFYSWFDLWKMNKVVPFETRWKDVTTVAAEIQQLVPVLLSVQSAPMPTLSGPTDAIGWRVYAKEEDVYLVAVNADRQPVSVAVTFPKAFRKATSLLGNQPSGLDGRTIPLSFEPLEVKVVRLSK